MVSFARAAPSPRPTYVTGSNGQRVEVRRAVPVEAPAPTERRGLLSRLFGPRTPRPAGADAARPAEGRAVGAHAPRPINQLDFPGTRLGHGPRTIAEAGCFLSSITMASNNLHPGQNLGVVAANERVKAGGGFSGSALEMARAAPALGMDMTSRRTLGGVNDATVLSRLDQHLRAGKPAVAGVDFRAGSSSGRSDADHFITVYGKRGGDYLAMDPAGGRPVTITRGPDGRLCYRGAPEYKLSEVALFDRR